MILSEKIDEGKVLALVHKIRNMEIIDALYGKKAPQINSLL